MPRETYQEQLSQLQEKQATLGRLVEDACSQATSSLATGAMPATVRIRTLDREMRALRADIEDLCLKLIATQQPMATDLRIIFAIMAICEDLERIGHHATSIMRFVKRHGATAAASLADAGEDSARIPDAQVVASTTVVAGMPRSVMPLSRHACARLHDVLTAFATRDTEMAYRILDEDDEIDAAYDDGVASLLGAMGARQEIDAGVLQRGMSLLRVMHKLERIGDRVTNIAERVIFLSTGELTPAPRSISSTAHDNSAAAPRMIRPPRA